MSEIGAVWDPKPLLAARTDQGVHLGLQDPVRHVGVDPVVDGEVARGANRPDKVDRHLAAQPGRGRRAEQYVDRHSGLGECVARVVDALIGDGDEVAGVVRPR